MSPGAVDANQDDHIKALEEAGAIVHNASQAGSGFPDLVVWNDGSWFLIEVKDGDKPPSKRKLTPAQKVFHKKFAEAVKAGKLIVSKHPDEALAAVTALTQTAKMDSIEYDSCTGCGGSLDDGECFCPTCNDAAYCEKCAESRGF